MPFNNNPLPATVINPAKLTVNPTQEEGPFRFWVSFQDSNTGLRLIVCDNHLNSLRAAYSSLANQLDPAGVYLLIGPTACYVGQSKDLKQRLTDHSRTKKENFFRLIAVHRADLRTELDYLESAAYHKLTELGVPLPQQDLCAKYQREQKNLSLRDSDAYDRFTEIAQIFVSYCLAFGLNPSSYSQQPNTVSVPVSDVVVSVPYTHQPQALSDCKFTPLALVATPPVPSPTPVSALLPLTLPPMQSIPIAFPLPATASFTSGGTPLASLSPLPDALQPVLLQCQVPRLKGSTGPRILYGHARYYPNTGIFVLLKDSFATARTSTNGAGARTSHSNQSKWLPLPQNPQVLVLQADYICSSSSQAATLITGTSARGPRLWKTLQGKTLREVMDQASRALAAQRTTKP